MNFNILNPTNIYSSQEVQKNVQPVKSEPNIKNAYVEPVASQDKVTLSQEALSGEQSKVENNDTYDFLATSQRNALTI